MPQFSVNLGRIPAALCKYTTHLIIIKPTRCTNFSNLFLE